MGVFTYKTEYASVIPSARLYNVLVLDADNLIPKIAPQAIKTAEILEGDGGVGTIKKISFGEGSEYSFVKHKVDGIDKDNFVYSYSLIEGDAISETIEKISYEIKLMASGNGSIIKNISHYHTKGDVEIKEEHVKAGKEVFNALVEKTACATNNISSCQTMADKNKGETVHDANPHDLKDYFEFAHAIAVAMGNNCPIAKWRSWDDVPGNVKKAVMDEVLCKYTLDDDMNEQLMKLMDNALERGYNRWRYEVLRNGPGSSK